MLEIFLDFLSDVAFSLLLNILDISFREFLTIMFYIIRILSISYIIKIF